MFLIQKAQNKDSKAIHLELNELIASHQGTSNHMVNIEDLSEADLDQLYRLYIQHSALAEKQDNIACTHSIDAAEENHQSKQVIFNARKSYLRSKALKKGHNEEKNT